jgi:hypothetical protein
LEASQNLLFSSHWEGSRHSDASEKEAGKNNLPVGHIVIANKIGVLLGRRKERMGIRMERSGGEMTQTLYANMNKDKERKNGKEQALQL